MGRCASAASVGGTIASGIALTIDCIVAIVSRVMHASVCVFVLESLLGQDRSSRIALPATCLAAIGSRTVRPASCFAAMVKYPPHEPDRA